MNKRYKSVVSLNYCLILFVILIISSFLAGCVQTQPESLLSGKRDGLPVKNVQGKNLKQGLTVVYFQDKFKHINDMPQSEKSIAKFGRPGPPVLKLDHKFVKDNVFDSGRSTEVGMLMRGYLHLDKPGDYLFQALSNDGFQLVIDGNLIVSDPGVHGDRLSETGQFHVAKGGMFSVEIKYFQRKGTAALKLYWQPPGATFVTIVPSGAYSHIK